MRTGPRANLEAPLVTVALAGHAPVAINLNQPGSYLNWNIFTISVANLVLIAVMVAIFGAALLLPFPGRHRQYARHRRQRNRTARRLQGGAKGMSGCGRRACAARR